MSTTTSARIAYRKRLLATVSTLALTATIYAGGARAADTDRPILWIEGGWHFEDVKGLGDPFDPSFAPSLPAGGLPSMIAPQQVLSYSYGGEGKISFQPEDSSWIFSASIRYGRSHGHIRVHHEILGSTAHSSKYSIYFHRQITGTLTASDRYEEFAAGNSENHAIVDFQAAKDVGLGLFGSASTSTLGLGVRFAQFHTQRDVSVYARPDTHFVTITLLGKYPHFPVNEYHNYNASARRSSSFKGLGPSISWNASAAVAGAAEDGAISLDWGANAALLFGKQTAKVHRQSSGEYHTFTNFGPHTAYIGPNTADPVRRKTVLVPNLGGFAGLSFRYVDAKLSVGYRADFFFGAIDGGIDTRHNTTRGFYGPFANISIGMGN